MKFLLCGINAKYIHSNLAIYCLRAYAKAHGLPETECLIKEYTINHHIEDILIDLYEAGADVIIFSCYIWNISYVRELAGELKKINKRISIWAGGPEVSYDAETFLTENPSVDLVMQGEGEETFTALTGLWQQISKKDDGIAGKVSHTDSQRYSNNLLAGLQAREDCLPKGIALRKTEGGDGVINTGFAPPVNLDDLPFVYDGYPFLEHKIIYYESSRGCPFRCSYCLSSIDKSVRFRSLSLVFKELQYFLDAGIPQVKFVDRTFNCNRRHALAIWRYLYEHDNGVTNFHFEISSDLLEEEELELFALMRPGLIQLEIGVQSTHPPTIEAIRRRMDLPRVFHNVDRVHALGNIHQHLDLIAGLPFESYEQFRVSFNDLYAHSPDQLQLGFLKVLKGTFMEESQEEYRIRYRSQPPYEVLTTRWLTYDDIIRLKGIEEMVETYYNSMQFTWVLRYAVPFFPSPFDFYEQFAVWYKGQGLHQYNHSRLGKYEILRSFLMEGAAQVGDSEKLTAYLDEMLIFDMYLRENLKKRPEWAKEDDIFGQKSKQLYREHGNLLFPSLWQSGQYDSKKAAGFSHLETFSFDLKAWMRDGKLIDRECLCVFDYGNRNPLNHNADVRVILKDEITA